MATARKRKVPPQNKKPTLPEQLAVSVRVTISAETPVYYANFIEVAHSNNEFALNVVRVPTKLTPEQFEQATSGNAIDILPDLQILIPPDVARGLIAALTAQVEKFDYTRSQRKEGVEK